jgi:hypothetical protein
LTARHVGRRQAGGLLLALGLAACGGGRQEPQAGPESFAPLRYDYLPPLGLNVASVVVELLFVPGGGDLAASDPVRPADAIRQMAHDRLQALGTSGRAVLLINDASILRLGDGYQGSLAIELDIYTSANTRAAFAEARVSASRPITGGESTRRTLYELTKQLMDALNVELEYQVRRSMRDWLVEEPAAPAPVQQQTLPPPPRV